MVWGSLLWGIGCGAKPPMTVDEIHDRYAEIWNTMQPAAAVEAPLLQLGMPGPDHLALWLTDVAPGSLENATIREVESGAGADTAALGVVRFSDWNSARVEVRRIDAASRGAVGLKPSTRYRVTLGDGRWVEADTAPDPAAAFSSFSFLAFSCNRPYVHRDGRQGFLARDINALNLLRLRAQGRLAGVRGNGPARPAFMVGLGDQVYVDPDPEEHEGLAFFTGWRSDHWALAQADGASLRRYLGEVYRRTFGLPPFAAAARSLPSAMIWDDHEIRDGWGSQGDEAEPAWQEYFRAAHGAFAAYQAARNPNHGGQAWTAAVQRPVELDTEFSWGASVHFFLSDLRTARRPGGTLLSAVQKARLLRWLERAGGAKDTSLLVVGFPVPLAAKGTWGPPRYVRALGAEPRDDLDDGWEAHDSARAELLSAFKAHFARFPKQRLLVLSGDIHESRIYTYEDTKTRRTFGYELVSSGITNYRGDEGSLDSFLARAGSPAWRSEVAGVEMRLWAGLHSSPSFAEVVVNRNGDELDLGVLFFPTLASGKVANLAPALDAQAGLLARRTQYSELLESAARGVSPAPRGGHLYVGLPSSRRAVDPAPVGRQAKPIRRPSVDRHAVSCTTELTGADLADHWFNVLSRPVECVPPRAE